MSIVTWNVNSLKVRFPHLETMIKDCSPDVICLQETKTEDANFPLADIENLDYFASYHGQKTYNGVAILSRERLHEVQFGIPNFEDNQARVVAATSSTGTRIINVYVPNGEAVDSEKYVYKLSWFRAFIEYVRSTVKIYSSIIILGDFNIAPRGEDVYDPEAFQEKLLCSAQERTLFEELLGLGFSDAFHELTESSERFTWWDYRMNAFRRKLGLRIDHILMTESEFNRCAEVNILKEFRKMERPSDHAPVMATFI
mgnify:FL=1